MWPKPQFPADLVTITEEILNGKLHILCSTSADKIYKTRQSGCTIKASLISNEISHARQFESRECKYDMIKRLSNSNLNLRKCASSIQLLWDQIDLWC